MVSKAKFDTQMRYWSNFTALKGKRHQIAATKYSSLVQMFGLPTVVITTITGTAVLSSVGSTAGDEEQQRIQSYIVGVLNLIAGILAAVRNFLGLEKKQIAYQKCSKQYMKFSRKVNSLKLTTENDNKSRTKVITDLTMEFNTIADTEPSLPENLMIRLAEIQAYKNEDNDSVDQILNINDTADNEAPAEQVIEVSQT